MHKITISDENRILYAPDGALLSDVLLKNGKKVDHPCGGKGVCKKCTLLVDGESVLSCRYRIVSDILVQIPKNEMIATASVDNAEATDNMCICLDIGTTTIVLAVVNDRGQIVKITTHNNPQRAFGADVMNRIDYAAKNGVESLHHILIDEINQMIEELNAKADILYVAGNTTMLHLFFGIDPSGMGVAPYTPVFLEGKKVSGKSLGIKGAGEVVSLPNVSAFVGADIVSGLGYVNMPTDGKYNILIDLGTNAEIVLYSNNSLYCTAAAAGPCFEGVNISCGMSATDGAICSYTKDGIKTIGGVSPKGICATGLIDILATMLDCNIFDETGYMECEEYEIWENVNIIQKDIRQFQLAKSAIYSGMEAVMKNAKVTEGDIEKVYVAGGFSDKMNFKNAVSVGLFNKNFADRLETVNNSCLLGLVKYACEKNDLNMFLKNAKYVDLILDECFNELFIENMGF